MSDGNSPTGLYVQDGEVINTHSMLKTFRRCPKQAEFKYVHRLKPRLLGSPLKRGVWIHSLLEAYHGGGDWRQVHRQYCGQFAKLFDEEKDYYGDMPREIEQIMLSYIWHYKNDPWVFHEVEAQIEARFPNGWIYRGKVDSIIENQFGFWLVDHKSHKTLPDHNFRLLDSQSALYLWAAIESGIPVRGFIWNYIRWKAPSTPAILKDGSRLSKSACDTDYPTYVRALKKYKEEHPNFKITQEYRDRANYLRNLRYEFGRPQTSTFFRRDVLEKSPEMLQRVMRENYHTAQRMNSYDFTDEAAVERVVERSCSFSCSYVELCAADIMGGNIRPMIRQNYTVGDPNDYYNDRAGDFDKEQR